MRLDHSYREGEQEAWRGDMEGRPGVGSFLPKCKKSKTFIY